MIDDEAGAVHEFGTALNTFQLRTLLKLIDLYCR